MKCPAKVVQALGTHDGRAIVIGYEDGAIQMFLIVDHSNESHINNLYHWRKRQFPSKVEPVKRQQIIENPSEETTT